MATIELTTVDKIYEAAREPLEERLGEVLRNILDDRTGSGVRKITIAVTIRPKVEEETIKRRDVLMNVLVGNSLAAIETGNVDYSISGDWEDPQLVIALG